MPTKEPTPPPKQQPYTSHDVVEYVLKSALRWRKLDLQNSSLAEAELNDLRYGVDLLQKQIDNPLTSPPPPLKR